MTKQLLTTIALLTIGYFIMRRKRRIDENGLAMLKKIEGLSLTAYEDGNGFSIGYGHFMKPGEPDTITKQQAERYLQQDIKWAEFAVWKHVDVKVTQNQFNALVSFVYNVGETQFRKSTMLRLLNEGDIKGALKQFPRWNKSQGEVLDGLIARRETEMEMFVS